MSKKTSLIGENVSFAYSKDKLVIKQQTITITNQDRIAVLAPSGYGKTTLCKLLSGYIEPLEGTISLDGCSLKEYRGYCPVQMIWQHPEQAVNKKLKMEQILSEVDDINQELIEMLGIEKEWLNRYPSELSGGELQRFCIARALGKKTKFLIADEITTMMDLVTQCQIWKSLIKITERQNIGMMIVSHDMELIKQVATKTLQLK